MKRHAPQVREYMTHLPVEAEKCETAADALGLMQRHQIHHLPVMSGSHLKGLVSQPDLLAAQVRLGKGFADTPLEKICVEKVVTVGPVAPIDEVSRKLLENGVDSAAVMDGGFVVGIFTVTDVLRFVGDFFGQSE